MKRSRILLTAAVASVLATFIALGSVIVVPEASAHSSFGTSPSIGQTLPNVVDSIHAGRFAGRLIGSLNTLHGPMSLEGIGPVGKKEWLVAEKKKATKKKATKKKTTKKKKATKSKGKGKTKAKGKKKATKKKATKKKS